MTKKLKFDAWGRPIPEKDFDENKGYWYLTKDGEKSWMHPNLHKTIKFMEKHNLKSTDTPSEAIAKITVDK